MGRPQGLDAAASAAGAVAASPASAVAAALPPPAMSAALPPPAMSELASSADPADPVSLLAGSADPADSRGAADSRGRPETHPSCRGRLDTHTLRAPCASRRAPRSEPGKARSPDGKKRTRPSTQVDLNGVGANKYRGTWGWDSADPSDPIAALGGRPSWWLVARGANMGGVVFRGTVPRGGNMLHTLQRFQVFFAKA